MSEEESSQCKGSGLAELGLFNECKKAFMPGKGWAKEDMVRGAVAWGQVLQGPLNPNKKFIFYFIKVEKYWGLGIEQGNTNWLLV